MITATGIYFGTTSSGAGDDPSLRSNQVGIAYPSSENSQGLQAPAYWVQRDEIKHLESQIASLLADAARDPSRNTPQLNREIERLDNEIDMLRLNAMQNQSADGPLSSEQDKAVRPLSDSRAIERLEEQISIMLFNAARAGKPLSKKEIERLDAQMDLMLAAEAQDRSVTRTGGRMK
jgi:hypothetical protein